MPIYRMEDERGNILVKDIVSEDILGAVFSSINKIPPTDPIYSIDKNPRIYVNCIVSDYELEKSIKDFGITIFYLDIDEKGPILHTNFIKSDKAQDACREAKEKIKELSKIPDTTKLSNGTDYLFPNKVFLIISKHSASFFRLYPPPSFSEVFIRLRLILLGISI